MKETDLDIARAKLKLAKRDEKLRSSQESIKSREELPNAMGAYMASYSTSNNHPQSALITSKKD